MMRDVNLLWGTFFEAVKKTLELWKLSGKRKKYILVPYEALGFYLDLEKLEASRNPVPGLRLPGCSPTYDPKTPFANLSFAL